MTTIIDCLNQARDTVASTYELDDEILQNIYDIFRTACKPLIDAKPVKAAKSKEEKDTSKPVKESKHRAKTAYNMYVQHQFKLSKEAPVTEGEINNSQTRMSAFSGQWAKLSAEDKLPYVKMATDANESLALAETSEDETGDAGVKKPEADSKAKAKPKKAPAKDKDPSEKRRITGYNLFYSENKDKIKADLKDGEKIMTVVGSVWKALSEAEKTVYNTRAGESAA